MKWAAPVFLLVALLAAPGVLLADQDPLLDPGRAEGRARRTLYKVQMQRSRGEVEEARQTLREHLADHPDQDHALLHFHLGQVLAQSDSMEASAVEFAAAVALEPDLAPAWRNLGEVAYGLAAYDDAARAFGEAWRLDPGQDPELRYYQGVALLQAGRAVESTDVLADLLADPSPDIPLEWYRALLAAAVDADRPDRAGPVLERMTTLHAEDPEAWFLAYQQASAEGDYGRAVRNLTVTGYLRPLTVDERRQLGDLCLAADAPGRAALHFAAVVDSTGGGSAEDLDRLISAHLAADQTERALRVLERRLATAPSARFWRLKGELHYGRGEYGAAREAFAAAAGLDPDNREYDLLQGYCLIESGDFEGAGDFLRRVGDDPRWAGRAREALVFLEGRLPDEKTARAEP